MSSSAQGFVDDGLVEPAAFIGETRDRLQSESIKVF